MSEKPMYVPFKSTRRDKKYDIFVWKNGKRTKISFGDAKYGHYRDDTKAKAWSKLDHLDLERRRKYIMRASQIVNKKGELTADILSSPNFYSLRYLWAYKPNKPLKDTSKATHDELLF